MKKIILGALMFFLCATTHAQWWGAWDKDFGRLTAESFTDRTPIPMITLASDQHGCDDFPATQVQPLANNYHIPYTVYIARSASSDCEQANELSDALLTALVDDPFIEVGSHGNIHTSGPRGGSEGLVQSEGGTNLYGVGTSWASEDVGKLVYIGAAADAPYIVISVTDADTLVVDRTLALVDLSPYLLFEPANAGTIATGTNATTCNAGCDPGPCNDLEGTSTAWATEGKQVIEPLSGGDVAHGSIVILDGVGNNPFFVCDSGVVSETCLLLCDEDGVDKNPSTSVTGEEYGIMPWFDLISDLYKHTNDQLVADSGQAAVTVGSPGNTFTHLFSYVLRHGAAKIESVAVNQSNSDYTFYGHADPTWLSRFDGQTRLWNPKAWRNFIESVIDSQAWAILNLEGATAADYKVGKATITDGDDTVTFSGGADVCGAAALADCRDTSPTSCWLVIKDDPTPITYRIKDFSACPGAQELELDPVDNSFGDSLDYDHTPAISTTCNSDGGSSSTVCVSDYWIWDGTASNCTGVEDACSSIVTENLEEAMRYLNDNRARIFAATHRDGVRRYRQLSQSGGLSDQNLIPNPKFRIVRADLLPPRALYGTGPQSITPGWLLNVIGGTFDASDTLTVDDNGIVSFANSGDTETFRLEAALSHPTGAALAQVTMVAWMDASDVTALTSLYLDYNTIDALNTMTGFYKLPNRVGEVEAGDIPLLLWDTFNFTNPGIMYWKVTACDSTCVVTAQAFPGAGSLPGIIISDAGAGDYRVNYQPTSGAKPLVLVQSLTAGVDCVVVQTASARTTDVDCYTSNTAATRADADFLFMLYDAKLSLFAQEGTFRWQVNGIEGTARFGMPALFEGGFGKDQ